MVNKKYLLLAGLCSVLMAATPALAQESESATASWSGRDMTYRGESYDVLDSSYYPKGRLNQYRRYINHQTPFPPKPRNMWEVGVNVGALNVIGDVVSKNPLSGKKFTDAAAFGITVRKALGYAVSLRAQFIHGNANGFDYQLSVPNNPRWGMYKNQLVYMNYRNRYNELTLQLVGNIANINFHKAKNAMSLYGYLGTGVVFYKVDINALDANNQKYDWSKSPTYGQHVEYKDREETNDFMKDLLDDTYEQKEVRNRTAIPLVGGLGVQFKLSTRLSLQLEDHVTLPFDDALDNKQYTNTGNLTPDKDIVNYASLGLNFNLGNKRKNVAPLWWVNPLDYAYGELADPRHMRLPDPILPDSDNDGIADQFDKCPGTPAGVAVDSHGCPMDTDGDGVPDYKDKQLITPTECQPVDADGVGKCPCPDGCPTGGAVSQCGNIMAGSLNFAGNSSNISMGMQSQLGNLAAQMSAAPTCKVVIIGAGNTSKMQQQRSWDRVNAVIEHMSEKHGIDRNRFVFQYGAPGDPNAVMYRAANAGEEGPANVAPPFPNLRRD
jgi:OOP family OmpA-OmpF porin